VPKKAALEKILSRMTIGHMERAPQRPMQLCNVTLPGTASRMYPAWPPPWWPGRTLVLPYVVDESVTEVARDSGHETFTYAHWFRRPYTLFFAGNVLRNDGAAFVRTSLTKLNIWPDSRIHCTGFEQVARREQWKKDTDSYMSLMQLRNTSVRIPDLRALRGHHCRPPLTRKDLAITMASSKFCLCPRGDSPSSSRAFFAIALGCIPIIISDPWKSMAMPFHGLIKYEAFAHWLSEGEAITTPIAGIRSLLESLGASLQEGSLPPPPHTGRRRQSRWHFPRPGSPAAERLAGRLDAMHRVHRTALWNLAGNQHLANVTLASAVSLWERRSVRD
jgi:hypothetical protein